MRKIFFTVVVSLFVIATQMWADATQPLNFTAVSDTATIKLAKSGNPDSISLQYSIDNCATWSSYVIDQEIQLSSGDKVFFKAVSNNSTFSKYGNNQYHFEMTGEIEAAGNIMSLLDEAMEQDSVPEYAFMSLFSGCPITTAPELPAHVLTARCYCGMFQSTALAVAPELPATMLNWGCYENMFGYCTSLTTPPALPATTLAQSCYSSMFNNCSSLKTLPELPATTLAAGCYEMMFSSCASLRIETTAPGKKWQIPANADTTNANYWNGDMFDGTSGSFTGKPQPGVTYYIASDTTTAVEQVTDDVDITLFPNPIHIGEPAYINTTDDIQTVEIYNPDGKCVQSITPTTSPIRIDDLNAAGIYIIRLTTRNNTSTTRKLIVQ